MKLIWIMIGIIHALTAQSFKELRVLMDDSIVINNSLRNELKKTDQLITTYWFSEDPVLTPAFKLDRLRSQKTIISIMHTQADEKFGKASRLAKKMRGTLTAEQEQEVKNFEKNYAELDYPLTMMDFKIMIVVDKLNKELRAPNPKRPQPPTRKVVFLFSKSSNHHHFSICKK